MKSWKIATLAGIGIYVHWSFLILPLFVAYSAWGRGESAQMIVVSVLFVLAIFGCVLLHELGHALMARRFGIQTRNITLLPIGGVANLDRMPERPLEELMVALAGPLVNVAIAAMLLLVVIFTGPIARVLNAAALNHSFLIQLLWANVILVLFNLLPAFPMDGGRVLRAILATRLSYVRATDIATRVGRFMAIVFAIAGFMGQGMLLLIAIFVYVAGRAEAQMARAKASLQGWSVGDAMLRRFQMLPADAPLREAAQAIAFSPQEVFPVLDGEQLVGMLDKARALRAAMGNGGQQLVQDVMRRDVPMLDQDTPLAESLTRMQQGNYTSLPVSRRGHLVGLITANHLRRWMDAWSDPRHMPAQRTV